MKLRTIRELRGKLKNKKVLVRTDYNVPLKYGKNTEIVDDFRIRISLKTLKFLMREGAKITIISHLGRPKGYDEKLSLEPIAKKLSALLKKRVILVKNHQVLKCILKKQTDEIVMLDNLRFNKGEEKNNFQFAKGITKYYNLFVFDAFSVAHRKHASTYAIAKQLKTYAGFRFEEEIKNLSKAFKAKKPLMLIVGGLKIKTKIGLINNFSKESNKIIIGGAMMFTFIKAEGGKIGSSVYVPEELETAKNILKKNKSKILLPTDAICARKKDENKKSNTLIRNAYGIENGLIGLDIGPHSLSLFEEELKKARTIIWNGPLGYYENPLFSEATNKLAKFLTKQRSFRIICGGDTLTAVRKLHIDNKFDFVSSGGGASLFFLSGRKLPILKFLSK